MSVNIFGTMESMERIFILVIVSFLTIPSGGYSQNLLINGDFEEVIPNNGDMRIYRNVFYAKDWFQPTNCSVDIFRDTSICSESNIKSLSTELDFCISVFSGKYCIGFFPIVLDGHMEHITGHLKSPLIKGEKYKISFNIKQFDCHYKAASKGFGYKLSTYPYIFGYFDAKIEKPISLYQEIFRKEIYADFQINEYVTDTTWREFSSIYQAKGGEMYITFGNFSFEKDSRIRKQCIKFNRIGNQRKAINAFENNRSLVIRNFGSPNPDGSITELLNYYFVDNISVIPLKNAENYHDTLSMSNNEKSYNVSNINDNHKQEFQIDPGFYGKISFELSQELNTNEALFIDYGKKHMLIIINIGTGKNNSMTINHTYEYPANRIKKRPITIYQRTLAKNEIHELKNKYKFEAIQYGNFKGIIYQR